MPAYTGSLEQLRLLKWEISAFLGIDVTYLGDYLVAMSQGRLSLSVVDEYIAEPGQRLMIPHLQFIPGYGHWTTDQLYEQLEQVGKPFFLVRAFKQKLFPERETITTRPPNPAFLVGAFWSLFFQNPLHNQPSGFFPQLPHTVQDAIRKFWSEYLKVLHGEVNPGAKYNPGDPVRKLNVPKRERKKSGKIRSAYSKSVKGKERALILPPKVPSRKKWGMAQKRDEMNNSSLISSLASLQFADPPALNSPGSSQLQLSPAMSYTSQYTTDSPFSGPLDTSTAESGVGQMLRYSDPGGSLLFSEAHLHSESAGASSSEHTDPWGFRVSSSLPMPIDHWDSPASNDSSQTTNNHEEISDSTSRYYNLPPTEFMDDMHMLEMWLSQWAASGHSSSY